MMVSTDTVTFRTSRTNKRLLKMLAARLDYDGVSALLNTLIEREIRAVWDASQVSAMLGEKLDDRLGGDGSEGQEAEPPPVPKARTGRRRVEKAA